MSKFSVRDLFGMRTPGFIWSWSEELQTLFPLFSVVEELHLLGFGTELFALSGSIQKEYIC